METNKKPSNKFSPEVRARAVRMVQEHRGDHASQWAAIASIAREDQAARAARRRNGGCAMRRIGLPVFRKSARAAPKPNTTARRIAAFSRCSIHPAEGYANWSGPLLARALGDVNVQYVWRFLRAQKMDLSGRKSWCVSNDPEFDAKAAEMVGFYLAPPVDAVVLAIDEKPSMQALERAPG